jgi:hypothetical protein
MRKTGEREAQRQTRRETDTADREIQTVTNRQTDRQTVTFGKKSQSIATPTLTDRLLLLDEFVEPSDLRQQGIALDCKALKRVYACVFAPFLDTFSDQQVGTLIKEKQSSE